MAGSYDASAERAAGIQQVVDNLLLAWLSNPDYRLGQLVAVAARTDRIFYTPDGSLEAGLKGLQDGARV